MTASALRDAAALMRARAEAATSGPWISMGEIILFVEGPESRVAVDPDGNGPDGDHIASWHPVVALAVADWLDACALVTEVAPDRHKGLALAVARAYLGTEVAS